MKNIYFKVAAPVANSWWTQFKLLLISLSPLYYLDKLAAYHMYVYFFTLSLPLSLKEKEPLQHCTDWKKSGRLVVCKYNYQWKVISQSIYPLKYNHRTVYMDRLRMPDVFNLIALFQEKVIKVLCPIFSPVFNISGEKHGELMFRE